MSNLEIKDKTAQVRRAGAHVRQDEKIIEAEVHQGPEYFGYGLCPILDHPYNCRSSCIPFLNPLILCRLAHDNYSIHQRRHQRRNSRLNYERAVPQLCQSSAHVPARTALS